MSHLSTEEAAHFTPAKWLEFTKCVDSRRCAQGEASCQEFAGPPTAAYDPRMRIVALGIVVQSEHRSQIGKRFNIGATGPTAFVADRGTLRIEQGIPSARQSVYFEANGRFLFAHSRGAVRHNGRELPVVGRIVEDGDELEFGAVSLRIRTCADLEAAYSEVVFALAKTKHAPDRHAN